MRQCHYSLLSPSAQALGSAPSPTEDFGQNPSHMVVAGGVSPSTSSSCLCQDPPEFSPELTMLHLKILRQMSSKPFFFPCEFNKEMLRLQPCIVHRHLSTAGLNWKMSGPAQRGVPGAGGQNHSTSPCTAPALPVPSACCSLPTSPAPFSPFAGRCPTRCSAASCALTHFSLSLWAA